MDSTTVKTIVEGTVAAALVAWSTALVAAGQQAPGAAAAVFTEKQAAAGKAAYAKSCASCHMPDLSGNSEVPALAGAAFKEMWGTRSTKDLFDYMSASMPYGAPSLTTEAYASIEAFILEVNGASAGPEALSASTAVSIASLMRSGSGASAVSK